VDLVSVRAGASSLPRGNAPPPGRATSFGGGLVGSGTSLGSVSSPCVPRSEFCAIHGILQLPRNGLLARIRDQVSGRQPRPEYVGTRGDGHGFDRRPTGTLVLGVVPVGQEDPVRDWRQAPSTLEPSELRMSCELVPSPRTCLKVECFCETASGLKCANVTSDAATATLETACEQPFIVANRVVSKPHATSDTALAVMPLLCH
jgi:hypothetical protein